MRILPLVLTCIAGCIKPFSLPYQEDEVESLPSDKDAFVRQSQALVPSRAEDIFTQAMISGNAEYSRYENGNARFRVQLRQTGFFQEAVCAGEADVEGCQRQMGSFDARSKQLLSFVSNDTYDDRIYREINFECRNNVVVMREKACFEGLWRISCQTAAISVYDDAVYGHLKEKFPSALFISAYPELSESYQKNCSRPG